MTDVVLCFLSELRLPDDWLNPVVTLFPVWMENQSELDERDLSVSLTRLKPTVPVIYVAPVEKLLQPTQSVLVLRKTGPVAAMSEAAVVKAIKPLRLAPLD
jgi:hypothetical protein